MKVVKIIYRKRLNEQGYPNTMYCLETNTFKRLPVKPVFIDDYDKLDWISETIYDDTEKKPNNNNSEKKDNNNKK